MGSPLKIQGSCFRVDWKADEIAGLGGLPSLPQFLVIWKVASSSHVASGRNAGIDIAG